MLKTSFVAFERRKASAIPHSFADQAACKDGGIAHTVRVPSPCLTTEAMATTSVVRDNTDDGDTCCHKTTKVSKAVSFNLKFGGRTDGLHNHGNGLRKNGGRHKKKNPSSSGCFGCISRKGDAILTISYIIKFWIRYIAIFGDANYCLCITLQFFARISFWCFAVVAGVEDCTILRTIGHPQHRPMHRPKHHPLECSSTLFPAPAPRPSPTPFPTPYLFL